MIIHKPESPKISETSLAAAIEATKERIRAKGLKAKSRELTANNIIKAFAWDFRVHGWGDFPPTITKETKNRVHGLAKIMKSAEEELGDSFYAILSDCVRFWLDIRQKEAYTINNKPWKLGEKPNLRDISICRDFFLSAVSDLRERETEKTKTTTKKAPRSLF